MNPLSPEEVKEWRDQCSVPGRWTNEKMLRALDAIEQLLASETRWKEAHAAALEAMEEQGEELDASRAEAIAYRTALVFVAERAQDTVDRWQQGAGTAVIVGWLDEVKAVLEAHAPTINRARESGPILDGTKKDKGA